ncbi:hypothetical protein J7337_002248 [Fusarium musae]|uniref:Catalase core domain-containing protein n=1 Tax=Fusarium musae TaxID=1042133 RepID=A0A9P8IS00_9HYPO|nr:hypothetical protein J7337_002248 [Fusarium musae]KAG9505281.1 hypothetical protein J7337_002248 [Fusarium musae]
MEGNYDIVGLNFVIQPVLFCRDPIQGSDVVRSQYRNPANFLDHDTLFDLLANTPEANHAGPMFFSDHGTPQGWRFNHGYGCHTFKWVNSNGEFVYIKYHFIAKHGQKQFTDSEAMQMCGEDPDYSKRDLWEATENGEEIEWTAHVQVMDPRQADLDKLGFDPFDVTKVWPQSQFPMKEFGRLVLNKNPENFHRDVEQAAFSPGSMVPGIEDSPDPLLQFRMFFYRDTQYHRIGVNLYQIPMRVDANHADNKQYAPNSFAHKFRPDVAETPYQVSDNIATKGLHRVKFPEIQSEYLAQVYNISEDYAQGIYDLLDQPQFEFSKVKELAETAQEWYKEPKFRPGPGSKLAGYPPSSAVYQA